jgi:hypothetical protein
MRQWQKNRSLAAVVMAVLAFVLLQGGPAQSEIPSEPGLMAQVAALQSAVATLQRQLTALQGTGNNQSAAITALQNTVSGLQATLSSQQGQISATQNMVLNQGGRVTALEALSNNQALQLGPYVSVQQGTINGLAGPHVIFYGANVHVRSGSGATDDNWQENPSLLTGRGNLVIGYNEPGSTPGRIGSHNLVVGPKHSYVGCGGLLAGYENAISGPFASITGGNQNGAQGYFASVCGGFQNHADGSFAVVAAGENNRAAAAFSSVLGGGHNTADANGSAILGGARNHLLADATAYWTLGGGTNLVVGPGGNWWGPSLGETTQFVAHGHVGY